MNLDIGHYPGLNDGSYGFMPLVKPEFKKVLRMVLTLLLHPTPTESGFYTPRDT